MFVIFQLCPWLARVGDWALRWTNGNKTLQVFFVMLFFPVVMNALQYYIIDGFIKNQKPSGPQESLDSNGDDNNRRTRRSQAQVGDGHNSTDEADSDSRDEAIVASDIEDKPLLGHGVTKLKINPRLLSDYDPATDGEQSPTPSEIRRRNSPGGSLTADERQPTARHSS